MNARILVVDDDQEIVDFLVTLLELEGFEPVVSPTGTGALEVLSRERCDLVLMDIAMPDIDGIELCRTLKRDPRTQLVPVFMVSARPGSDVVDRARDAGAEEFVRKPFENAELVEMIRRRLGNA